MILIAERITPMANAVRMGNELNEISPFSPWSIRCKKRDKLIEYLKLKGISSSVHLKPLPLLSVYKKYNAKVPNALRIWKELVSLPLFPDLKKNQVKYIIQILINFDNHYKKF